MPEALSLLSPVTLAGGLAVLALAVVATRWSLGRVAAQVRAFTGGPPGYDLERDRRRQAAQIRELERRLGSLEARLAALEAGVSSSLQGMGLVRFNAFDDTGSDQSFALALVDAGDNGFLLTSLYGRNESRIYAKPLLDGQCPYKLSGEEMEALSRARTGKAWASLATGQQGNMAGGS